MEEYAISYETRKCSPSEIRSDLIGEVIHAGCGCTYRTARAKGRREKESAARSFSGEIAEPRGRPSLKLISPLVRCVYPAQQT